MIIKGGSRGAPGDLAKHLLRSDTNEHVVVLEVAWATPNLREALTDWQTLTAGTRGFKGLYHANIDPAKDYTLSGDQWAFAVDALERELGLEGQPRAIVMHQKHGREHIHVVWARTDIDTMKLRSDSGNYAAHERVSRQLEQTFGHTLVPGPHTGRDPDLPNITLNHAEWQQAERTGVTAQERRDAVRSAWEQSDTGAAFRDALADKGYMLAVGDRRGFVAIDKEGEIVALGKRSMGVATSEIGDRLASLGPLPSVEEARAAQRENTVPIQSPPKPYGSEADAAMLAALAERQQGEQAALTERQAEDLARVQAEQAEQARIALEAFEREQAERAKAAQPEPPPLVRRLWRSLVEFVSPGVREAREAEEARQKAAFEAEIERQREAHVAELARAAEAERSQIEARHDDERRALEARQSEEHTRRLADAMRARDIAEKIEEARAQMMELQRRQGFGRGPPGAQ